MYPDGLQPAAQSRDDGAADRSDPEAHGEPDPDTRGDPNRVAPWRYVVPNAITSASLLIGVIATYRAVEGHFVEAGWLIVLCTLLDKADGTAARALGASTKFGMQLDSLVDFVAFGIAPAFTVFMLVRVDPHGTLGWWQTSPVGSWILPAAVGGYILCTALRLARFNVVAEMSEGPASVFWGMPTTMAGGLVGLTVITALTHDLDFVLFALPAATLALSVMMVSNLRLPKLTPRDEPWLQWLQVGTAVVGYVCGLLRILPELLLTLTLLYAVIGFSWGIVHRKEHLPPGREPRRVTS